MKIWFVSFSHILRILLSGVSIICVQGPFSFDMFYESLVKDIAPVMETAAAHDNSFEEDGSEKFEFMLQFPEAPKLLPLFKHTRNSLGDLCYKVKKLIPISFSGHHIW